MDEVGNPTILATLTVIAAILPMAFVGGLMGPYMRPIPIGAAAAMVFSLLVAFIVTPWAARADSRQRRRPRHTAKREDRLTRLYRRVMGPLLHQHRCALRIFWRWSRSCCSARCALVLRRLRQGEDAAVRQQERVPGHRRHARGTTLEADGARRREHWPRRRRSSPKWSTSRPTPAPPRPTTSTAWCATTICAADRMSPTSR